MNSWERRGLGLVSVLLIFGLLLVVGLSLLTKMQLSKSIAARDSELAAAENLAMSGLIDFRTKLALDPEFPPSLEDDSPLAYSESLQLGTSDYGRYEVAYSLEKRRSHGVIVINSTGILENSRVTVTGYLRNEPGLAWLGFSKNSFEL